jgi:hypothetical protein
MALKRFYWGLLVLLSFVSCKYDDSAIWDKVNDHAHRIEKLEALCNQMNTNISSLQSIVGVLQNNDYITAVSPIQEDGKDIGYTIHFSKSDAITIYHGTDGKDGMNGTTPLMGVKSDTDGVYYWTLDGNWLLDEAGNKIQALATDGKDGESGITPKLKIEEGCWYVSYNQGKTWEQIGKATGTDGDSMFSAVTYDETKACFTLVDGTTIEIPVIDKNPAPVIKSVTFSSYLNPQVLIHDLPAEIVNDTLIEARIPHLVNSKLLTASLDFVGEKVMVSDTIRYNKDLMIDFTKPVKFTVSNKNGDTRHYWAHVYSFTGLPVMYITVNDYKPVTSKDYYMKATMRLVEDIETRGAGDVFESAVKIKGRGNSTWNKPKKPYKLKFDSKVSLLGEPKDKEWVLLANYIDKTAIRNEIAFYMGRELSKLPYTCRTHYVELIMNNEYLGTYQLGEQQKISDSRVNVGDDGYLLEIDSKAAEDDITFRINTIGQPINIKEPDATLGDEKYNYIVNFMSQVEATLYSANWLDKENGWKKYMDMDSFVDWYLINEMSKNQDAVFFTSCFMHHRPGGKLCMGPLWDFDLAFGNANYNMENADPKGWYIKTVSWYTRLFEDPEFVKCVKDRFNHYYANLDTILREINDCANYLQYSTIENNNKWNVLYNYTVPNVSVLGVYENEVHYLKSWFINRMEWLKTQFDAL